VAGFRTLPEKSRKFDYMNIGAWSLGQCSRTGGTRTAFPAMTCKMGYECHRVFVKDAEESVHVAINMT